MTDRTLKAKVSKLQELQAEADRLKDQIKAEMTARTVDELEAAGAVIRWKPIATARFDAKAFGEAHSGLYAKFAVQTESRRFTLVPA